MIFRLLLPGADHRSARVAGIALMLAAIALFSVGDVIGKFLVTHYPVGQFMLLRGAVSLALLAPFIWAVGRKAFIGIERPGLQALRMALSVGDVGLFFLAVAWLPLADVITFYLAVPIYLTAISALVLGERVGWRRGSAVAVGFIGVLIALRPSTATLTWPALIALVGSLCFAGLMIVTRSLRRTPDVVLTATHLAGTTLFGAAAASVNWVTPSTADFGLYLLGGVLSIGAVLCLNRSLKLASSSVVAPYQYTMIVWAMALGYVVFGDVPTLETLAGAAIIAAAGLYIFLHDRGAAAAISPPP